MIFYLKIALVIVILFITILLILRYTSIQDSLIFYPTKLDDDYKFDTGEEYFLNTSDGQKINGLFFRGESDKVILYFHGNAGSLESWQYVYQNFKALGHSFFIIDYRGYGKSTGKFSEDGFYIDGKTAYDFLVKKGFTPENIIVYGISIGTGIAVDLASKNVTAALILQSPYKDFVGLCKSKMPFLLPSLILRYRFDNAEKINRVKSPLLVICGEQDNLIPSSFSKELFEMYDQNKKEFVTIMGGGHNDLPEFEEFGNTISSFMANYINE